MTRLEGTNLDPQHGAGSQPRDTSLAKSPCSKSPLIPRDVMRASGQERSRYNG